MPETHESITPRCAACGSDAIVDDARVAYSGSGMITVSVYLRPDSRVSKKPVTSKGHARVCGDCGYVMVFADDPRTLWDAYVDRLANDL